MLIDKLANDRNICYSKTLFYDSARNAFGDILDYFLYERKISTIFLPAYIGISPKEGSGLYDPVRSRNGLNIIFYKMNKNLIINTEDLFKKIDTVKEPFLFLFVNYFGFIDSGLEKIHDYVQKHDGFFIEDNAHAFFTHYNQNKVYADIAFFSLHKQFPFDKGGMLRIYNNELDDNNLKGEIYPRREYNLLNYSFIDIQRKMVDNYNILVEKLLGRNEFIIVLRPDLFKGIVPQSFPVLLIKGDRFDIYNKLNADGFGVTSLYHTMIDPIQNNEFEDSLYVSQRILNLPVHQDVDTTYYDSLVNLLIKYVEEGNDK